MTTNAPKYSVETKIAGIEAILYLMLSTLTTEEKIKLSTNGLELIKILKNQPQDNSVQGQNICEYIADILDNSVNLG